MLLPYSKFCKKQDNLNKSNCHNNQPRSSPLDITRNSKQQTTIPNQYSPLIQYKKVKSAKPPYAIRFNNCMGCLNNLFLIIFK
jgi:hypothetical protein